MNRHKCLKITAIHLLLAYISLYNIHSQHSRNLFENEVISLAWPCSSSVFLLASQKPAAPPWKYSSSFAMAQRIVLSILSLNSYIQFRSDMGDFNCILHCLQPRSPPFHSLSRFRLSTLVKQSRNPCCCKKLRWWSVRWLSFLTADLSDTLAEIFSFTDEIQV